MKKLTAVCALALALTMALAPAAYAAEGAGVPHASPAMRVAWGTEEQGSEHSFRSQAETEQSGLCDAEALVGISPSPPFKKHRRGRLSRGRNAPPLAAACP